MNFRRTVKAFAKINPFLDIACKRADGYHNIETIMQSVDIYDTVTISVKNGSGIEITCDNPQVPTDESNIVYKAIIQFMDKASLSMADTFISVDIQKNIPLQAGLGGGSADGAEVLLCLNWIYGNILTSEELLEVGKNVGADVPFCIVKGTALCTGIGEKIKPLKAALNDTYVIVKPEFSCDTKKAYALYDSSNCKSTSTVQNIVNGINENNSNVVSQNLYNIFYDLYDDPRLTAIYNDLRDNGATNAVLTGSGSAVVGIFQDSQKADEAIKNLNYPYKVVAKPLVISNFI